jgi:hypothetical protein
MRRSTWCLPFFGILQSYRFCSACYITSMTKIFGCLFVLISALLLAWDDLHVACHFLKFFTFLSPLIQLEEITCHTSGFKDELTRLKDDTDLWRRRWSSSRMIMWSYMRSVYPSCGSKSRISTLTLWPQSTGVITQCECWTRRRSWRSILKPWVPRSSSRASPEIMSPVLLFMPQVIFFLCEGMPSSL